MFGGIQTSKHFARSCAGPQEDPAADKTRQPVTLLLVYGVRYATWVCHCALLHAACKVAASPRDFLAWLFRARLFSRRHESRLKWTSKTHCMACNVCQSEVRRSSRIDGITPFGSPCWTLVEHPCLINLVFHTESRGQIVVRLSDPSKPPIPPCQ
jgi:hypothetical protein